jgi:glycosyltransferase involved in cell wall biosynthesis
MNILQIAPRLPFPLTDGGAIGIYNITKHLSLRGHGIRFVTFGDPDVKIAPQVAMFCNPRIIKTNTKHSIAKVVSSLLHGEPYVVRKYYSRKFSDALDDECRNNRFDIVHADHLAMAPYAIRLKKKYGMPIVLREHNLETFFFERLGDQENRLFIRYFAKFEASRLRVYEPLICMEFNRCVMITEKEKKRLEQMNPLVRAMTIPAGVNIANTSNNIESEQPSILFLSSLDWEPNVQGFFWFYENVLPRLVEENPSIIVTIIGKGECKKIQHLSHPNVRVVGYVEDVSPYIGRSWLAIVPLFTGSGMRIKILELFAHGKAVVSTSVGCEGINVRHGGEILIADTPGEFGDCVLRIMRDEGLRRSLGSSALKLVKENHTWETVAEQLEKVYQQEIAASVA